MEFHPIAEVWPLMEGEDLAMLAMNIKEHGLRHPILLYEGRILDGRNRWLACDAAMVAPVFEVYDGKDPIGMVLSLNQDRRHLHVGQRALIAARLSNLGEGKPIGGETRRICRVTQAEAAQRLAIGERSVHDAAKVLRDGCPVLVAAVESGAIPVSTASSLSNLTPLEQTEVCELDDDAEIAKRAKEAEDLGRKLRAAGIGRKTEKAKQFITLSEWKAMAADERAALIDPSQYEPQIFNRQKNELIDWALRSWNPITGCEHDCPYCYARELAQKIYPHKFEPTLYPGRLSAPDRTPRPDPDEPDIRARNVFTGSMSDIFGRWVPDEWIAAVLEAAADAPWWNFLFLTKFPQRVADWDIPANCWMGTTVDHQARVANAEKAFAKLRDAGYGGVTWLSVEPMLTPLKFKRLDLFDLVVIGGATATKTTPEWHPPLAWIAELEEQADKHHCKIYYKENLLHWRKELPGGEAEPNPTQAPQVFQYLGPKLDVVK
jgi:protein gp37